MINNKRGFIKIVILIIVGILILSYFKIDLRNLFSSDTTQGNLGFVWQFIQHVWYDYIKAPVVFILAWTLHFIQ